MFHLDGGLMLSIYPRSELAKDAAVPLTAAKPGEFSIGHVVASRAEVDEVIAQAKAAGAAVTDPPHDRPWGIYSGYFQDPDGHLWEIIWNPALEAAGSSGADVTVIVQLPVAWTLKFSVPEASVTSVLPDPEVAMTLGSDSASAPESLALTMKLSPPETPSASLPEKVHETM